MSCHFSIPVRISTFHMQLQARDTVPNGDTIPVQGAPALRDTLPGADSLPFPGESSEQDAARVQDSARVQDALAGRESVQARITADGAVDQTLRESAPSSELISGSDTMAWQTPVYPQETDRPDPGALFTSSVRMEQNPDTQAGMDYSERLGQHQPGWLFFYLFLLLSLYAWVRIQYGNILARTFQASTNFNVTSRMFQDNSLLQNQLDSILYGFYFLSVSFLLLFLETSWGLSPFGLQGAALLLFNFLLLASLFVGRVVVVNLAGFLFNRTRIFREYLYNMFIFNKLLGIVLLPLLVGTYYTTGLIQQYLFWITLAVVVIVILLRIARGIVFSLRKDVLIFYMFLYLCALELVPLLLLYRWLEGIL